MNTNQDTQTNTLSPNTDSPIDLKEESLSTPTQTEVKPTLEEMLLSPSEIRTLDSLADQVFKHELTLSTDHSANEGKISPPLNAAAYDKTQVVVVEKEQLLSASADDTLVKNVKFGYMVQGEYRKVGYLSYMKVNASQEVTEIGVTSPEIGKLFLDNLRGINLTPQEMQELHQMNSDVIAAIRANPHCAERLNKFNADRDFKSEWSDRSDLAYFHPRNFDVLKWGTERGYTPEQLYLGGFVKRSVSQDSAIGEQVTYQNRDKDIVFIPFKDKDNAITLWRMRVIRPKNGPKYLSAPLERAVRIEDLDRSSTPEGQIPLGVTRELYNAQLLEPTLATGSTVLITEGEFKCMVTKALTGVDTVGITGITQISNQIVDSILLRSPERIIITLDLDPEGMRYHRAVHMTDSEMATFDTAYRFEERAKELVASGVLQTMPDIRVGTLPDASDGGKVGIDDWLLEVEKEAPGAAKSALEQMIEEAQTLEQAYTQAPITDDFVIARCQQREIRRIIRSLQNDLCRNPRFFKQDALVEQRQQQIERLTKHLEFFTEFKKNYLSSHFSAQRENQPDPSQFSLLARDMHHPDSKIVTTGKDKQFLPKQLNNNILQFYVVTKDLELSERDRKGSPIEPHTADFTLESIQEYLYFGGDLEAYQQYVVNLPNITALPTGQQSVRIRDLTDSFNKLNAYFKEGCDRLKIPQEEPGNTDLKYGSTIILAGYLSQTYPDDSYKFHHSIEFTTHFEGQSLKVAELPLAIERKAFDRGKITTLVSLPLWSINLEEKMQGRSPVAYGAPKRAQMQTMNQMREVKSFLRMTTKKAPEYAFLYNRLKEVANACYAPALREKLDSYGLSRQQLTHSRALVVPERAWFDFIDALETLSREASAQEGNTSHKGTRPRQGLNYAVKSGLLSFDEKGAVRPSFQGDALIIPKYEEENEKDNDKKNDKDTDNKTKKKKKNRLVGFDCIPLSKPRNNDSPVIYTPQASVQLIPSSWSMANAVDPNKDFFLDRQLKPGKELIVFNDATDALVTNGFISNKNIVAHRIAGDLTSVQIARIKELNPKRIIFVDNASTPLTSRIDNCLNLASNGGSINENSLLLLKVNALRRSGYEGKIDYVQLQDSVATQQKAGQMDARSMNAVLKGAVSAEQYLQRLSAQQPQQLALEASQLLDIETAIKSVQTELRKGEQGRLEISSAKYLRSVKKYNKRNTREFFNTFCDYEELLDRLSPNGEKTSKVPNQTLPPEGSNGSFDTKPALKASPLKRHLDGEVLSAEPRITSTEWTKIANTLGNPSYLKWAAMLQSPQKYLLNAYGPGSDADEPGIRIKENPLLLNRDQNTRTIEVSLSVDGEEHLLSATHKREKAARSIVYRAALDKLHELGKLKLEVLPSSLHSSPRAQYDAFCSSWNAASEAEAAYSFDSSEEFGEEENKSKSTTVYSVKLSVSINGEKYGKRKMKGTNKAKLHTRAYRAIISEAPWPDQIAPM